MKKSTAIPSKASETTIVPMTVPLANATRRPLLRLMVAAAVVRILARVATVMPI